MALYSVGLLVTGGDPCPSEGDRASGSRSAALLHADVNFAAQFSGGPPGTKQGVFRFDAGLAGNQMSGSYALVSDSCPQCRCGIGGSGTWSANR